MNLTQALLAAITVLGSVVTLLFRSYVKALQDRIAVLEKICGAQVATIADLWREIGTLERHSCRVENCAVRKAGPPVAHPTRPTG